MRIFSGFIFVVFSYTVSASLVEPGDGPYFQFRDKRILYLYDSQARDVVSQVQAYLNAIHTDYERSFSWKLDEEQDLILASSNQQIANAYATVVPNILSFWYPSGAGMLENFAESSWFLTLATHETAHLYQLNAKGRVPAALKTVFGNAIVLYPYIWPIFIHPNLLTPTFLLEGNAVLNESRANMGGRLHSGEVRALVLAQIENDEIDPNRLINTEFRFPFGQNAYFQGGYFQTHLASKYGVDRTNSFFLSQGDHYLWPLILNQTFRDHFGASYPQEIREYVREYKSLAHKQKSTGGKPLTDQLFIGPLNHDEENIYFLTSDGLNLSKLHTVHKGDGRETAQKIDLPMGKVFFVNGEPRSAATEQHDLHHIEYSLYGEEHAFDPQFRGQIVTDRRANNTVAFDAAKSWLESHILLNDEPYDIGDSNPILDSAGSVYYFRQNGAERIMYKNRQPLFKYEGFYGKAMEVADDGTIYFIANTDTGSTLYMYKDHEIWRVLASDRVVDARVVNRDKILAVEVYPSGYQTFLATAEPKPAQPAVYAYGFPSYNLTPSHIRDEEQIRQDERAYNATREMRYSSLSFVTGYDGWAGIGGLADLTFIDPLEYQSVTAEVSGSQFGSEVVLGQYTFTKYLPQFFASYLYQRDRYTSNVSSGASYANDQQVMLGATIPLLRWRHYDSALTLSTIYSKQDLRAYSYYSNLPTALFPIQETYGVYSRFSFSFQDSPDPSIALWPFRSWQFGYQNKLESLPGGWTKHYNTSLVSAGYEQALPRKWYAKATGNLAWAENHDIHAEYDPYAISTEIRVPRLSSRATYYVKTAGTVGLEFNKVFDVGVYSPRIPLGLERIAPFVTGLYSVYDRDNRYYGLYPGNQFEWGYGFDLQLLLLHSYATTLRFLQAFDPGSARNSDTQALWSFKFNF